MAKVTVYSKDYCPYCVRAKALLKERGIPFDEEMVDQWEPEQVRELYARSGMRTVPQIFHGEKLIGGYDQLAALDKVDKLESIKKS